MNKKPLQIEKLSACYRIRRLYREDIPMLLQLCKGNPLYYFHRKEEASEALIIQDMTELPPDKTYDDKYFFGFFEGDALIAAMDLIDGYPDAKTAYIGWFMMDKSRQGKGIGTEIISGVLSALKAQGFCRARLGFIKGNPESKAFWIKNQFAYAGYEVEADGYTIVAMERPL